MALTKLTTDLIDGSLGTDWQSTIKTANFTAVAGEGYFVNTTSAAITVTLPSSPTAGDELTIVDYAGTADTNNITITSSDNINGAADDVLINYERGGVSMVYVDATQGWIAYNATNETDTALVPDIPLTLSYLVVAGGAAGGTGNGGSGGGGAGGLLTNYSGTALTLSTSTNYLVTIGAGGAGIGNVPDTQGNNGSNSVFSTITADGGGGGGAWHGKVGKAGGSGGGGGAVSSGGGTIAGGTPTAGQGNSGGTGHYGGGSPYSGGGGGGAGAAGQNATSGQVSNGGDGLAVSITGSSVTYAAGGGAGTEGSSYPGSGLGGSGGGGNGGNSSRLATSGTTNTGSGGGGGGWPNGWYNNGSGGSGIVILRYPSLFAITNPGSGLTFTTATVGSDYVTTFTDGTGNIQFN
jgi:hypothetical protein